MQGTKRREVGFRILNVLYDRIWSLMRQKWVTSRRGLCELKLTREFKNIHTHKNNLNYISHRTVRQSYKLLDERSTTSHTLLIWRNIRSYRTLRDVECYFLSTFRDNLSVTSSVAKKSKKSFLDFSALEYWTDRLIRNVGKNDHSTLRNVAEEGRSHLHRGRSLKSFITFVS